MPTLNLTMLALSQNLKRLRKANKLTQAALAEAAGLDYKHYQRIEAHQWEDLRLSTVVKLAEALKVEPEDLLASASPKNGGSASRARPRP